MSARQNRAGRFLYRAAEAAPHSLVARLQLLVGRSRRARALIRKLSGPARRGTYRIASGPAKGLAIDVAGSRPSYVLGTAEPELQALLAEHLSPGDIVLDLGANVGFFTLVSAALVGPRGRVIAYEPLPTNAHALRHNVSLNDLRYVEVVEAAVSDKAGTARLGANHSNQDGSIVTHQGESAVNVRTVSVDDEMLRLDLRPSLVKIDVEGAESAVLAGMIRTLRDAQPIVVCEVHATQHVPDGPIPSMLRKAGYNVRWLEDGVDDADEYWAPHLVAVHGT